MLNAQPAEAKATKGEVNEFREWLRRNIEEVMAISENSGCQCCVDSFTLELSPKAEPIPKSIRAVANDKPVHSGERMKEIINEYLDDS